jgi:GntR family transcriptional repressor for pyruvate dehydrogenase complex
VRRGAGSFVSAAVARAVVAPSQAPSTVAADELAAMRMLVEPAAADWAARRADEPSVRVLRRIADQFVRAIDAEPRYDVLVAADVELHVEIARCADNALLASVVEELQGLASAQLGWDLRRPDRVVRTAVEHAAIVDAIAAGDPDAARAAMAAHVTASAVSLRELSDAAVD